MTTRNDTTALDPELDVRRDRSLLGALSLIPGALLVLALVTLAIAGTTSGAAMVLLAGHVVTQFIVLLAYGSLLMNDERLDTAGRWMWGATFLFAAPVALPVYFAARVLTPARPEPRVSVHELSLAAG
jgi:hypothetical protein